MSTYRHVRGFVINGFYEWAATAPYPWTLDERAFVAALMVRFCPMGEA